MLLFTSVIQHSLGDLAALFLLTLFPLKILLLFYLISRFSWCHLQEASPNLLARTGMLCYLLSADTQCPPGLSKLVLYHRYWKSGNYITQIPLLTEFQFTFIKWEDRAWDLESKKKKRINHYLLQGMADRYLGRWQLLKVLLLPHFPKAKIGFPLSLLPHQFYKYWISCNKSLPLKCREWFLLP